MTQSAGESILAKAVGSRPYEVVYDLQEFRFRLAADDPTPLHRVKRFLPLQSKTPEATRDRAAAAIEISQVCDSDLSHLLDRLADERPPVWEAETFQGEWHRCYYLEGGLAVFRSVGAGGYWTLRKDQTIAIVATEDSRVRDRLLLRVFREVLLRLSENAGAVAFHAAAVAMDGCGVLITGPSGCGKTTLATAICSLPNAAFITNDLAAVRLAAPPAVGGFPLPVRIAEVAAAANGALSDALAVGGKPNGPDEARQQGTTKLEVEPEAFCSALGCRWAASAELRLIILPHLVLDKQNIRSSMADPRETREILLHELYTPCSRRWQRPWIQPLATSTDIIRNNALSAVDELGRFPAVHLTFGIDIGERISELQLLEIIQCG